MNDTDTQIMTAVVAAQRLYDTAPEEAQVLWRRFCEGVPLTADQRIMLSFFVGTPLGWKVLCSDVIERDPEDWRDTWQGGDRQVTVPEIFAWAQGSDDHLQERVDNVVENLKNLMMALRTEFPNNGNELGAGPSAALAFVEWARGHETHAVSFALLAIMTPAQNVGRLVLNLVQTHTPGLWVS